MSMTHTLLGGMAVVFPHCAAARFSGGEGVRRRWSPSSTTLTTWTGAPVTTLVDMLSESSTTVATSGRYRGLQHSQCHHSGKDTHSVGVVLPVLQLAVKQVSMQLSDERRRVIAFQWFLLQLQEASQLHHTHTHTHHRNQERAEEAKPLTCCRGPRPEWAIR